MIFYKKKILKKRNLTRIIVSLCIIATYSGCKSNLKPTKDNYPVSNIESGIVTTLKRPEPDDRGIIEYTTYKILIASGSETVSEIAVRLNISGDKLALYNGLIPNYRPREGEVIALPSNELITDGKEWSEEITRETIENFEDSEVKISSVDNPLRHRIKSGETIYSIARYYNVSVNALATWNGLGPDLEIKTGREIIIPAAASTIKNEQSSANTNIEIAEDDNIKAPSMKNSISKKTASEDTKFQDEPAIKPKEDTNQATIQIDSANAKSEKSNSKEKQFLPPVSGKIISGYSQSNGSNNNNGIDYETIIGQPVIASASGKVVLISEIVGGDGKIVLIRHENQIITIYGRLINVIVSKGEAVVQGQKIGEVLEDKNTNLGKMHFEIRKGMESIDPEQMLD